ncbi:HesB/IscA family protein [Thiorhodovibrio litoralis]|uniref:HesB/IscA family protein n=1 Tax=Thiorhodovibrio litoralis TaxID=2952932 RepID=UPI002B260E4C|nr:iron-sulfur cluster assembly accessory protein [Thiorhodovibrio litoralis]WPL11503.1 Iron-sulfur cluster insertion protein ErpA [Thiorhodovibrio litoralis]
MSIALTESEVALTGPAVDKMTELFAQVEDGVQGVRVYAAAGGCSGVSFGMTFTDNIGEQDGVRDFNEFKVVVDDDTLGYLRGVEIDFVDQGDGNATFVFNNLPTQGGGCSSCGSSSQGGCSS